MPALRRLVGSVAALAAGALALTGCSVGQLGVHAGTVVEESVARISLSPAATGKPVAPATPLVVKVKSGRLTDVVVSGPRGTVPGTLSSDGLVWTAAGGTLDSFLSLNRNVLSSLGSHAPFIDDNILPLGGEF